MDGLIVETGRFIGRVEIKRVSDCEEATREQREQQAYAEAMKRRRQADAAAAPMQQTPPPVIGKDGVRWGWQR